MALRCSHCGRTKNKHNGPDGKYQACLVLYRKPACLSSCNGLAHDDRCTNRPSLSEQMQGELEPLPTAKKWDGDDIGEVLKHGGNNEVETN